MKKTNELSALAQTLFIPLAVRAKETVYEQPLFSDKMAVTVFNECDTDGMVIDGGEISTHGILARTKVIDDEINKILTRNAHATIINLGAGLDTRFFRLDKGVAQWYDLDLPEVISLRRQFFSENERLHFISKSVLDDSWINKINSSPNEPVIIIAEGLLMYFPQDEVKQILNMLVTNFPKADMFFDVVHSFFTGKKISSSFLWGIAKAKEIESLDENISVMQTFSAGDLLKKRQSKMFRLLNIFPSTKNRSQIIHLKLVRRG